MSAPVKRKRIVKRRPAEVGGGVAGAIVGVIVWVAGIDDPSVIGPLILIVGSVPAGITWLVSTIRGDAAA